MKRAFNLVCCLDVVLLLLPTGRLMSSPLEFWLAATLTVVTASLWMYHKHRPA